MSTSNPELVLVVDDTVINLQLMSETLTQAGYEVATAISGEEALDLVEYDLPEIIFLDVQMPGIDGFETCKRLKQNHKTQDIPIIFMTALADSQSKVRGFNLGAVDYITKPFQEVEVIARLKTHLRLAQLNRSLEQQVVKKTAALEASQVQLVQSEKMSALGQLVAGIAHELNNPIGSITNNLTHVDEYIQDLFQHLRLYQQSLPQPKTEIVEHSEAIDFDFLVEDLPKLMQSIKAGADRIVKLSSSLRTFSRNESGAAHKVSFDIHESLDSTLLILQHRLKANKSRPAIAVTQDYGNLPPVKCYPGQLSQVFMNLISNAIDALEDANRGLSYEDIEAQPNQLQIQTALTSEKTGIIVRIWDNGIGIPDDIKAKIFDYLFTTKEVGRGTGLGLSITHQIIAEKHGGKLWCESAPDQGTAFFVELPLL
ncbi:MAG: hybrid sensor histidine kinase/response regulator [Cyanobacteria bacterium J06636_16]